MSNQATELLALAQEIAAEAVLLVRSRSEGEVVVAATKSSEVDIVTEADRACEALIVACLAERRPDDGFLGEEGASAVGTSGVRWILDPIDGTVNFLYAIPQYAVSIAAEVDGTVVAGVVVNGATGREYAAAVGQGATGDGQPLRVRPPAPLGQRLIGTGFSYDPHQRSIQGAAVARLLPNIRDIRRQGSCALDLCHVAEGRLDGYVEEGVNLWDYAAAGLIAREAGALTEVTAGVGGRPAMICAPTHGFVEFRAAVESAGFLAGFRE